MVLVIKRLNRTILGMSLSKDKLVLSNFNIHQTECKMEEKLSVYNKMHMKLNNYYNLPIIVNRQGKNSFHLTRT